MHLGEDFMAESLRARSSDNLSRADFTQRQNGDGQRSTLAPSKGERPHDTAKLLLGSRTIDSGRFAYFGGNHSNHRPKEGNRIGQQANELRPKRGERRSTVIER